MSTRGRDGAGGVPVPAGSLAATRRAVLRLPNRPPWSGRIARWSVLSNGPAGPLDAVIAIPARDEAARIEACLDACSHSAERSGLRVRLLVLANGTRDDTVDRALAWAVRHRRPITLVDIDFTAPSAHAGAARRLALEIASLDAGPRSMLLTTDADARPRADWVEANVARLCAGASLVCGRVALDPVEACLLPAPVRAVGEIEGRYKAATLELQHLLDPDPWNPWPHHGSASGASLAIRVADLAAVGGVPLVACGEDRALARRVRVQGLPVVHADEVEIQVSCRLRGRAENGMADALRERAHDPDPLCDEALEPAVELCNRLAARARVRRIWASHDARPYGGRDTRRDALLGVGARTVLATVPAGVDGFDRAWDRIERAVYEPRRVRLRVTDLVRELPVLLALIEPVRIRSRCVAPDRHVDEIGIGIGTGTPGTVTRPRRRAHRSTGAGPPCSRRRPGSARSE